MAQNIKFAARSIWNENSAMITDVAGYVSKLAIFGVTGDVPFLADLPKRSLLVSN